MKWLITTCIVLAMLTVNVEAASKLYGTTGTGITGGGSTLVELDPTTGGLVSTIGPVGYIVNGLAYDPTSGKLYGGTSLNDPSYNGLIEIDMTTGAGTPVGANYWGIIGFSAVTNITINSAGEMFGWWEAYDDLVSIDKATGIATLVGDSGLDTGAYGLAFDSYDTLYFVNYYADTYMIDTTTGAASYIGAVTGVEYAHHGDFDPDTNLYYGINNTYGPRSILVINISTLSVTSTLPTVDNLHTLAFVPEITEIEINVVVDIKPNSCPNPLNVKSKGMLPVAILGTDDFDVQDISWAALEGIPPVMFDYEDVATPFEGELCDCHETGPDGILDLILYFDTQEIVGALGPVADGDEFPLMLTGDDLDGIPIEGSDCIRIIKKGND